MGEPQEFSGEAASRTNLDLIGQQPELLDALLGTGKPVVLVLVAGRPVDPRALRGARRSRPDGLVSGHGGGPAVADVLFGDEARAENCR